jgi:type IV secretion system protein TrbE
MVTEYPPLADVLPYRTFIGPGLIDLRDEGILKGFWLQGASPDISDDADLLKRSELLGRAPVHCRAGDSIQIVYDKRPAPKPPELRYSHPAAAMVMAEMRERFTDEEHWIAPTRLYLTHQYEKPLKSAVRAFMLGGNGPQRLSHHDLLQQDAIGRFQAFEDAIKKAVTLNRMSNVDMFRDLLHCVTYRDIAAPLPEPHVRLNHVLACDWQVNGERPIMGEWHLRPIVISAYPNITLPQLLAPLLEYRGYLTLSIRFRCLDPFEAQKQLEDEKSFWLQSKLGNFAKLLKSFFGWDKSDDQDARKQIQDLNDAIAESQAGTPFGTVSCVAIVRDKDPDQADLRTHNLMGVLNGKGIIARVETVGAAKAIRSTWPGYLMMKSEEYEANRHKLKMTGYNFADASMPATYWEGTPTIHSTMFPADTPTPLVCGGTADVPFHFPVRVNGVGHILGIGKTGSGKSTFAAIYADAHLTIPNMRIAWMDSGRSSYVWSQLHGADYHDIGSGDSRPLCPLALLDTPNGLQWLMGWFERLFFRRKGFELDERGSKDLRNALQDVRMRKNQGVTNEQCRNLADLYAALSGGDEQRNRMRGILNEMIEGYGYIFAGEPVDATINRITVYELSNLTGAPKYIATPTKELIFQNIVTSLGDSPALIIWDEFFEAIADDISAAWFEHAIRSFRRLNCSFMRLTQSTVEILQSPYCNLMLGNMPGLLLFPMDRTDTPLMREGLYKMGLNDHEITRVAGANPGEFFYKSAIGARLASAWLGPIGRAICAATSYQDVAHFREIRQQCTDRDQLLTAWLKAQSIHQSDEAETPDGLRTGTG